MEEKLFDKVKKRVVAGAHSSALVLEEAARVGRLRFEIMGEKRRMSRNYLELGKEAHMALLEKNIATLPERPGVTQLSDSIEDCKKRISSLEVKLAQGRRKQPAEPSLS